MALDRSTLLNEMRLKTEIVELASGTVIVSELGAADYIKLWSDPKNQKDGAIDMSRFTPALITYAVVDETGKRVFGDEDIDLLGRSAQGPFLKLAEVARRLNGLSGEEKNDSAVTSTDLTSGESQLDSDLDTPTS